MKSSFKFSFALRCAILLLFVPFACKREKDTVAEIIVIDADGSKVADAMVRLYPDPDFPQLNPILLDDTLFTGPDGTVIFDYTEHYNLGQAGFAVLDIEVRKDSLYGEGTIRIQSENWNTATMIVSI